MSMQVDVYLFRVKDAALDFLIFKFYILIFRAKDAWRLYAVILDRD